MPRFNRRLVHLCVLVGLCLLATGAIAPFVSALENKRLL
jgi:hypothetical protein